MTRPALLMLITNLNFGGAQRVFHDHSRLFASRFDVTDVAFNLDLGHAYPSGNRLVSLDVGGGGGFLTKLRNLGRRVAAMKALKRTERAALCISHLGGADYVNLLSRNGEKTILVAHGSRLHDRTSSGLSAWVQLHWLMPPLYRRADRIVTVSRAIAEEFVALGIPRRRLVTIHNFFDPAAIRARAAEALDPLEEGIFAGPPVLLCVGRFASQKNHAALLDLFARLRAERPVKLVLVGDGPLRGELLEQARRLGLRPWVEGAGAPSDDFECYFVGFRDNPFRLMARAALLVMTSSWEGMPMVLGEAMACGAAIVATDCPTGPREFLAPDAPAPAAPITAAERGRAGWLMPLLDGTVPRDAALGEWTRTLAALLDDPGARAASGREAQRRAEDFSRDRIAPQWFALIDAVLQESA